MNHPPTERTAWIARCVWRLKRLYSGGQLLPTSDRGLTWSEHQRLVECVLAEYREDSTSRPDRS